MTQAAFSFPVDVVSLPAKGRIYDFVADAKLCEGLARELGLDAVTALTVQFTVAPGLAGSVEVTGHLVADVVQACVVTLQPVRTHIDEAIARRFVDQGPPQSPKDDAKAKAKAKGQQAKTKSKAKPKDEFEETEGWVDPNAEIYDSLVDGKIDLGEVAVEQLSLALDPYPRAPGATFAGVAGEKAPEPEEPAPAGPFAALAGLKLGKATPRRTERKPAAGANDRAAKGKTGR